MTATREPESLTVGDSASWIITEADYEAPTWTLSYAFSDASGNTFTVTASDNGDGRHLIEIDAATSDDYIAGEYNWQRYVTDGTDRYTTRVGVITLKPNLQAGAADIRSGAKKALDAIDAVIEGKASQDTLQFSLAGRSLERMSWEDLLKARAYFWNRYQAELQELRDDLGLKSTDLVLASFGND